AHRYRSVACPDARCGCALGGFAAHQQRADQRPGSRNRAELLRARLGNCLARHQEPRSFPHGPEPVTRPSHRVRLPSADARADRAERVWKDHVGLLRDTATRRLWRRLALLLIAAGLLGAAAPVSEYQLKAVFLFNFAQFVEWPPAAAPRENAPFVIGVLGKDPCGADLDDVVRGETVNAHPLAVARYHNVAEVRDCQILFIAASELAPLDGILSALKGPIIRP